MSKLAVQLDRADIEAAIRERMEREGEQVRCVYFGIGEQELDADVELTATVFFK